jgi:serralysin
VFLTLWDGGGKDTYDFSNYATPVAANLTPGSYVALGLAQRANLGDGHYARGNIYTALQYEGDPRSLIENAIGGSGNDRLTGNQAANQLKGGSGQDVLNGLAGNDSLWGGPGLDSFVFNTALSSSNVDRIKDFNPADDTIRLENGIFTALTRTGQLPSGWFHVGTAAHDHNDHVIHNKAAGALLYDPDGTGPDAALKFALLTPGVALAASDFYVV